MVSPPQSTSSYQHAHDFGEALADGITLSDLQSFEEHFLSAEALGRLPEAHW
jgi:hypothetical protein